jgi:transcriptional antiterminator NusG
MTYRWYILHTLSGSEKRVAQAIKDQYIKKNLEESFEQIVIPTEEVVEVRKGQKVNAERKFLPGYVLIKMAMNDETWHLVKNVPKVTGFLGSGGKPQPITETEVKRIFSQIEESVATAKRVVNFEVGEAVRVIDGPFESFVGSVEDIDVDKNRLKVSVSIFGRSTPVDLDFSQVSKV